MRRSGMIKNCLQLVSQSIVDFSIALDFCEKVYEEEQNQKDVFTQLFMELISQPNVNENSKKNIIRLVNTKTEFLDIVCVIQRIPSNIKLVEIKEFLKNVTVGMVNHNREKKIENALIQSTLSFKKQQLKYLKGGSVEITHDTLCATCRKPIKFSVFYVLNDNTIIHSACKPPQTDLSMD